MKENKPEKQVNEFIVDYQPTMLTVDENIIYLALDSANTGLEYAKMCLAEHDVALGRTTLKNKVWAERIETDIIKMTKTVEELLPLLK